MMSRSTCAGETCSAWARPPPASQSWYCVLPQMHLPLQGLDYHGCTVHLRRSENSLYHVEGVQAVYLLLPFYVSQQTSLA